MVHYYSGFEQERLRQAKVRLIRYDFDWRVHRQCFPLAFNKVRP